jgi:hypothetical protein
MREWQGRTYDVLVLDDGFSWQGTRYRSLSAIARKITGTAWSGPLFFGLKPNRSTPRPSSPILGPSDAPMAGSNAIRTEKHQERGRDLGGGRRRRSLRAFVARRQTSIWYRDLAAGGPATLQFAGRRLAVLGARRVSAMVVPDRAAPILCEDWKVGPSHYLNQDLGTVWLDQ